MAKATVGAYIVKSKYPVQEQEQKLNTWANENNARIYDFYVEENKDISVPLSDRREFRRLLSDVNTHKIDGILTVDFNRLSDGGNNAEQALNKLKSEGVELYSISDVLRGQEI